jgi:hypothetical protein
MNQVNNDLLAGKSQALKTALKAVERLGAVSARGAAKSKAAKKAGPGPGRCPPKNCAAV